MYSKLQSGSASDHIAQPDGQAVVHNTISSQLCKYIVTLRTQRAILGLHYIFDSVAIDLQGLTAMSSYRISEDR